MRFIEHAAYFPQNTVGLVFTYYTLPCVYLVWRIQTQPMSRFYACLSFNMTHPRPLFLTMLSNIPLCDNSTHLNPLFTSLVRRPTDWWYFRNVLYRVYNLTGSLAGGNKVLCCGNREWNFLLPPPLVLRLQKQNQNQTQNWVGQWVSRSAAQPQGMKKQQQQVGGLKRTVTSVFNK